ncbi:membrane protein [gut metagenome]|uniref:Membrane protein n=1 Tax=gut metagenome TaxID=749906 RepID=J9GNB6_9ZZZZ
MLASSLGALGITQAGILLLNPAVASVANLYGIQLTLSLPAVSWCCGFVIICCLVGYIVAVWAAQDSWHSARL